jgi:glycosyltransferase involved in cell wall biosynthesis
MKIVNIVPGFGGTFYCGNCLRDSAYVGSLRLAGHDAVTLPMYLPLSMRSVQNREEIPVFYGAVGIYMRQFPLLRNMPPWLEHLFNSRPMLKFAAKKAGSTRAHGMETLTESMLLGSEGHQNHELQALVEFLKNNLKPDIVHFSNALLLGMARQIREEAGVPVVFSLQDEDVWVDAMDPAYREKIWDLMAEKACDVDAFIAVSDYFAGQMQKRLRIPAEKLHVVHIGVDPDHYSFNNPVSQPLAIGYLSRICEENGFGVLTDAFIRLKKEPRFSELKLRATGGMTADDKPFLREQMLKLEKAGCIGDLEILHHYEQQMLGDFFRTVSLLCVPVLKGEAFGLYQLEALASGIPLVQPALGAFPEIIAATGGGVTYEPNTPEALALKLTEVLSDPQYLQKMGHTGRMAVENQFSSREMTLKMVEVYKKVKQ